MPIQTNRSKPRRRQTLLLGIAALLLLAFPLRAAALEATAEAAVPDTLLPELAYLLELTGPDSDAAFDPRQIQDVLTFVTTPQDGSKQYNTANRFDAPSAYIEFDLDRSLADILKLVYNPDMPGYVLCPTSVRWSHWTEVDGQTQPLPRLWELLPDLEQPYTVRGHESLENTPDLFAGTYFAYGLYRSLILFKHNGNNVLISLSKQDDRSEVGKKGLIVGADDDWNYLYSEDQGLGKPGLGWMRTYMYDSYSVMIYYEMPSDPARVRCAVFKWLRAGWLDLNVVKNKHIYKGLERFSRTFKEIIESPALPPFEELQAAFASIRNLPLEKLKATTKRQLDRMVFRVQQAGNPLVDKRVKRLYADDYIDRLSRPQLQSVLVLAYLKDILGKPAASF